MVPPWLLAKVQTDLPVPTLWLRHEPLDLVISLPGPFLLCSIQNLADEMSVQPRIPRLPQQEAIGWQAIAPGASRFLVILLDRFRQCQVNDSAHRGLVDAQPEGDRSNENAHF